MQWFGKMAVLAMLAGAVQPHAALAKKPKGLIKANANGKFKANTVKTVVYTGANHQLVITASQRKGGGFNTTFNVLTITCLGVDLVKGTYTQCGGSYSSSPLTGGGSLWTVDTASVEITAYNGKMLKAKFTGSGPANSTTNGAALTISGGVVKIAPMVS